MGKLGLLAVIGTLLTTAFTAPASAHERGCGATAHQVERDRQARFEHERREREGRREFESPRYRHW
jgi:hypothetical protein